MPARRTFKNSVLQTTEDDRTLTEAKAEATDRMRQAARDAIEAAMPFEQLCFAAFTNIAVGNATFDTIKTALGLVRVKLLARQVTIAAATTNADADAVTW